jgi:predicted transcriptional regulator
MTSTTLAATLRAELARAGRTQADIATLLGISQPSVSERMRGNTPWRVTELTAVAEFLNVSVSVLLSETDPAAVVAS